MAFGGGTGMSCLLSGLKHFTPHITAVVAMTDNGGSSGRLRKEFDMVPPGDIRSCLLALAEGDPLLVNLLRYRFEESVLAGHNFGNLFLTALTRVTGSFDRAVREANRMLRVRGKVLPATSQKISLIAQHPDGSKSTGEVQVSSAGKPISGVEIRPRVRSIAPDVDAAIRSAELMVFGPGSLFTSVMPNLLVDPIREAIARYIPPLPDPRNQVSQVSHLSHPVVSDALGAPERVPTGHQDTWDTSQEGPGKGGVRVRVTPLAKGSKLYNKLQERAAVLEREAGLSRAEAEHRAAEDLGLLLTAPSDDDFEELLL